MKKFFVALCCISLCIFPAKRPLKYVEPASAQVTEQYRALTHIANTVAHIYQLNPQNAEIVEATVTHIHVLLYLIDGFLRTHPRTLYAIKLQELRETILSVLEG